MIEIGGGDVAVFAADIHLDDRDPGTARWFLEALAHASSDATHVFLLGDLFEYWVGDDQPGATVEAAVGLLHALSSGGVQVFVMRGNRDFLLDQGTPAHAGVAFSDRAGALMLADPTRVDLFGAPTLLLHGDSLCTADAAYLEFRTLSRGQQWQEDFLRHSLAERTEHANALRAQSERSKADKRPEWMDVVAEAVLETAHAHGVGAMIHGHTHRPARHHHHGADGELVRWVLPDWWAPEDRADEHPQRGGFLRVSSAGWEAIGPWSASIATQ